MSRPVNMRETVEGAKGCFPGHALVFTKDGPVPIKDIKIGTTVICFDELGELHEGEVQNVLKHPKELILKIHYWGGEIDVTANHWMLNQYGTFGEAGRFTEEDSFIDQNGHLRPIKKIERLQEEEVYNLIVTPYHTYICDGIRVHNGGRGAGRYRDFVEGEKGGSKGGGSTHTPVEAPNTLASNTVARVLDVISEGEIEGLVNGLKSVFFNDTAIQNDDETFNFSGVNIITREGAPDQDYIPGFPATEVEKAVGVEVFKDIPVIRTITDVNATAAMVKIRLPSLQKQETTGDLNGSSVDFQIELQSDGGGFTVVRTENISGKTTSPYEASYRVELTGDPPWDIKVTRLSDDSGDDATLANQTIWSTYTKIIDNKLSYDSTALIGVEIDAKQFSEQVPSRGYEIKGLKVSIPSNYDPDTRIYTGMWDGSFITAWTDNPAWVLYDLLTNSRYGIGDSITASQIDKFALYEIAQYCDELVDDGAGGEEPRYTFNGVINTREDAYKVLFSVASSFRGMLYWSSGLVTAVADKDEDPVKLITPANVIDGIINYAGPSLKTLHSVALVRWNDPDDGYRSSLVAVEDPELIERIGWKAKEIVAYGCTSKGQAFRTGKWFIDTEKNAKEVATYRASFDNADVTPGSIISIADPSIAGVRFGGRISSATLSSVTVDSSITLTIGETYSVATHLPDGTVEERTITNTPDNGQHTVLNVSPDFSLDPQPGAMWVVTGSDVEPRKFRVISMTEIEKNIYEVAAIIHDSTKYARIEQNIVTEEPTFSILPTGNIIKPSDITASEFLYRTSNGTLQAAVTVSWTPPIDPRVSFYQLEMMRPNEDFWTPVASPSEPTYDIYSPGTGTYTFRVRAFAIIGEPSAWEESSDILLSGLLAPPQDIENFRINNVGQQSTLSWDEVSDLDLSHYIIKYAAKTSNARWGEGVVLAERVPAGTTLHTVPTLTGTYMIKAVDQSNVQSENAAFIVSNIGDLNQSNVIVTVTEDSAYKGVTTNITIGTETIELTDLGQQGIYKFFNTLDLGSVFTSRVVPLLSALGSDNSNTIDTWVTLSSINVMSVSIPEDWNAELQIRTTDDAPWEADSTVNYITNTRDFDNASWTKNQATVTADAGDAPDGSETADALIEDNSAASVHSVEDDFNEDPTVEKVFSVWAKPDGRDYIRMTIADAGATSNNVQAVFNLSTIQIESEDNNGNGNTVSAEIIDFGNGWVKCAVSGVPNTSGTDTRVIIELGEDDTTFTYDGNESDGVQLWGAELQDGADANTPVWSDWDEIIIGDYTARAFEFQLLLDSLNGNTTPLVSDLAVTIDMPDRIERGEDITTDGSGESIISFGNDFNAIPSITVAGQDMDSGDYFVISSKSASGFTINFYDSGDSGVQRTFDWVASGYGRKQ